MSKILLGFIFASMNRTWAAEERTQAWFAPGKNAICQPNSRIPGFLPHKRGGKLEA